MAVEITTNNSLIKTTSTSSLVSSISNNFTVNPGFFKALFICTYSQINVSSVTFGGQSFTQTGSSDNTYNNLCWWELLDPAEGTDVLTVNYSGSGGNLGWFAICLNGIDQTSISPSSPSIIPIITGTNPNASTWAGDLPNRKMKLLVGMQSNGSGNFVYDTGFDSFPDFASRTLRNVEDEGVFVTQGGGAYIGGADYFVFPDSGSYKFGLNHNWGGAVPSYTISYLAVPQTTEDAPVDVQMIII